MLQKLKQISLDKYLGAVFLVLFFLIGLLSIYRGNFVDEADNLVTGWLISEGNILYKDIFTHHFPFTYYWVALFITIFGKSLFVARFSILLFQISAFGIALYYYRKWALIGLTALVWGIYRILYCGNLVLYSSISGAALFAVFAIILSILRQKTFNKSAIFVIAVLSGIAFLTDPLSIYPICIGYIFLIIANYRKGILSGLVFACILGIFSINLLTSDTITNFQRDVLYFNQIIYNKYTYASAFRLDKLWEIITNGLNVTNSAWANFDLFYFFTWESTYNFDTWAFTGFFYRAIVLFSVIALAFRQEFVTAIFTYLFVAAVLVISPSGFRAQGFVIISLYLTALFCLGDIIPKSEKRILAGLSWVLRISAVILVLWVVLRSGVYFYQNRSGFVSSNNFRHTAEMVIQYQKLGCTLPGVQLIDYPGGVYSYWLSEMQPVSGYPYMWPWVAEIALPDVIETLERPDVLAIVHIEESVIWMKECAGLYHLGGFGSASRFEWAEAILALDPKREEQRVTELQRALTEEFPTPAMRPLYTALDCGRFVGRFGLRMPEWKEALRLAMGG